MKKLSLGSASFSDLWIPFLLFLLSNLLLSYFSLDQTSKWLIFVFGIIIPFLLTWKALAARPMDPSPSQDHWPSIPTWVCALVLAIGVGLRWIQYGSFAHWPILDEGVYGFFSLEIFEKAHWNSSYDLAEFPPLYYWGQAFVFKIFGPSLQSLWFFPALISTATLITAYFCFNAFFPPSFAATATFMTALGFWPLYLGRFSIHPVAIPLWIFMALLVLAGLLKTSHPRARRFYATFLALLCGLGFYLYISWAPVALLIGLALFFSERKSGRWDTLALFMTILFLSLLPLGWSFLQRTNGVYFSFLWGAQAGHSWNQWFAIARQYLTSFFWGVDSDHFGYKPYWGGLFDPVLGAFFGLGLVRLVSHPSSRRWLVVILVLLLPGLLTREYEMNRMVQTLPALIVVATFGLEGLLRYTRPDRRAWWMALAFMSILGLSYHHLFSVFQKTSGQDAQTMADQTRSIDRMNAYQIIQETFQEKGPGSILLNFESATYDQTLLIASYPYNAARNPNLNPAKARWVGVLTDMDYVPFLAKRFPESHWFNLDTSSSAKVHKAFGVIPVNEKDRSTLSRWVTADRALQDFVSQFVHLPLGGAYRGILVKTLEQNRPVVTGDPFLESTLDEKLFFNELSFSRPAQAFETLKRALTLGYPTSGLFNDLGVYWYSQGKLPQAIQAFRAALKAPVDHVPALENLQRLGVRP